MRLDVFIRTNFVVSKLILMTTVMILVRQYHFEKQKQILQEFAKLCANTGIRATRKN
jgi:hypothetical protein